MPFSNHSKPSTFLKHQPIAVTASSASSASLSTRTRQQPRKRSRGEITKESEQQQQQQEEGEEEEAEAEEEEGEEPKQERREGNSPHQLSNLSDPWYSIKEIIAERPDYYKVLWDGIDPQTGKQWSPDWVRKQDVTVAAIADWNHKKHRKRKASVPRSVSRIHTSPSGTASILSPSKRIRVAPNDWLQSSDRPLSSSTSSPVEQTQSTSEYQPSQAVCTPIYKTTRIKVSVNQTALARKQRQDYRDTTVDTFDDLRSPSPIVAKQIAIEISQNSYLDRDKYSQFSFTFPSKNQNLDSIVSTPSVAPPGFEPAAITSAACRTYLGKEVIPDSQDSAPEFDSTPVGDNESSTALAVTVGGQSLEVANAVQRSLAVDCTRTNERQNQIPLPEHSESAVFIGRQTPDPSKPDSSTPRTQYTSGAITSDNLGDRLIDGILTLEPFSESQSFQDAEIVSPVYLLDHCSLDSTFPQNTLHLLDSLSPIPHPPSGSVSPYLDTQLPPPPSLPSSLMSQPPAIQGSTPLRSLSLAERLAAARRPFEEGLSAWKSSTPAPSPSLSSLNLLPKPTSSESGIFSDKPSQISQNEGHKIPLKSVASEVSIIPPSPFVSQLRASLSSLSGSQGNLNLSQAEFSQVGSYPSLLEKPKLQEGEYAVALPLNPDQQKAYLQNIKNSASTIQDFCLGKIGGAHDVPSVIKDVLDRASRLSTHSDLLSDKRLDPTSVSEQKEFHFATLHPKFKFLKALFDAIRSHSIYIAILAREGRTLDILEIFLRGIRVRSSRLDGFSSLPKSNLNSLDGSVTVLLAPTGEAGSRVLAKSVALIVALDSTFDFKDGQVEKFRAHAWEVGRHAPVLHLVAANTVEHVHFYMSWPSNIAQKMSYVAFIRQHAGNVPSDYARKLSGVESTDDNWYSKVVAPIASSINSDTSVLELPDLPELSGMNGLEENSIQDTSITVSPPLHIPLFPTPTKSLPELETQRTGDKRTFSERSPTKASQDYDAKRQKIQDTPKSAPSPSFTQPSAEVTHVSNSIANQSESLHSPLQKTQEPVDSECVPVPLQSSQKPSSDSVNELPQEGQPNSDGEKPHVAPPEPTAEDTAAGGAQEDLSSPHPAEEAVPSLEAQDIEMQDTSNTAIPVMESPAIDVVIPWLYSQNTIEDAPREELIERLQFIQQQLNGHIASTSRLTTRFEEVWSENREIKAEIRKVKDSLEKSGQRTSKLAEEVWKYEEENRKLKKDLQDARQALISSDKPNIAALEQLRAQNTQLQGNITSLEKELKDKEFRLQIIEEQYQISSSSAAEFKKEMDTLKEENESLKRKANVRAVELRKAQHDNVSKQKDQKIETLTRQLVLKDQKIKHLELTLAISKGRAGTRSVSNATNRTSPNASRTTSPGPGAAPSSRDLPSHPLRNAHA